MPSCGRAQGLGRDGSAIRAQHKGKLEQWWWTSVRRGIAVFRKLHFHWKYDEAHAGSSSSFFTGGVVRERQMDRPEADAQGTWPIEAGS